MKSPAFTAMVLMAGVQALGISPAATQAQNPKQSQVPRTNFDCKGTVKDIGAGVFHLAADDGEQWLVQVAAQPKDISYTVSADASFLRPGMFVRISSKLNRRGQTDEKISDWTVFTPRADTPLGLNAEQTRSSDPDLFTDPKGEKRSKPKPKPGLNPTYEIAGRISKVTRTESPSTRPARRSGPNLPTRPAFRSIWPTSLTCGLATRSSFPAGTSPAKKAAAGPPKSLPPPPSR